MGQNQIPSVSAVNVVATMKYFIAVAALVAVAYSQQTPDERRTQLVNDAWDATAENGCFTRQTMQDFFTTPDGDNKIFELWNPAGDCVNEANFKQRAVENLKEC